MAVLEFDSARLWVNVNCAFSVGQRVALVLFSCVVFVWMASHVAREVVCVCSVCLVSVMRLVKCMVSDAVVGTGSVSRCSQNLSGCVGRFSAAAPDPMRQRGISSRYFKMY